MTFSWTKEAVARLRRLLPDNSCSQIGAALGCSRNAVIGKVHRLGLTKQRTPSPEPRPWLPKPDNPDRTARIRITGDRKPRVVFDVLPSVAVAPKDEPAPLQLTVLQLTGSSCRWPHGDGPFAFCGHATEQEGRPYCAFHSRLSVGRQPPRYDAAEVERRRRRAMAHLVALQAERGRKARR